MSSSPSAGKGPASEQVPDVRSIMERIRERIKEDAANQKSSRRAFVPTKPLDSNGQRRAGELLHSEELRYLNSNYQFARLNTEGIQSHRPGLIGKAIVKIKRKVLQLIWDGLLKEYFENERNYQANLVRYLNDIAKYTDSRDAQNFWELVRKIDVDTTKALERIERIADEQSGDLRGSERRLIESLEAARRELSASLAQLQTAAAQQEGKLSVLEGVASGLEKIMARIAVPEVSKLPPASAAEIPEMADYRYLLLENRFRGSEDEISRRLSHYPALFSGAQLPVLEIGGGRGELQKLFSAQGIRSYMVDMDAAMVEAAKAAGADARIGDGIQHLAACSDKSLSGVIAVQVVEHLTRKQLEQLFALAASKVSPGGTVVFETINPQSVLALSSNYFRDPTHVFPMHPDTMRYMMELAGFKDIEVRYLSPVPEEAKLRKVPTSEYMSPDWAYAVELINHNCEQLNALLYGCQDYCIIGRV